MLAPFSLNALQALAGLLTLVVSAFIFLTMPSTAALGEGWSTPIFAFELAQTSGDLAFLAGPSAEPLRAAMDAGHRYDMIFPFFYAGLLLLVFLELAGPLGPPTRNVIVGGVVAITLVAFDLSENVVLLDITEALRTDAALTDHLAALHPRTWGKWGTIGLMFLFIGVSGWPQRKVIAALAGGGALVVPIAYFNAGRPFWGELMGVFVSLVIGVLAIRAVVRFAWTWRRSAP